MVRLSLLINQDELVLHGEGRTLPIRGCVRQATHALPSGLCLETLDLVLQGSPHQTRAMIQRLQIIIERLRLGHEIWMVLKPEEEAESYKSRLYYGNFSWILNSVQPKGIGIRLELQRQDFWQLEWQPLPLTNTHGNQVLDGILIDNRMDAQSGVQNGCWFAGSDLIGDLPAPLRIRLRHDIAQAVDIDRIYIGMAASRNSSLNVLEGELANSHLNFGAVSKSDCHAGAYGLVQWESNSALRVLSWTLAGGSFKGLSGGRLKPLLRLVNPAGLKEGTWLSWKLYHGSLIFQSAAQLLTTDRELQVLPTICLPRIPERDVDWNDLRLELHAQNRNPGTTHLTVDMIQLFFSDGWRQFTSLPNGKLSFGEELIDQCDQTQPYIHISQTATHQQAYQTQGNGLWVLPGESHFIQIAMDTGLAMPLDLSCHLQLEYQPRVRMLT